MDHRSEEDERGGSSPGWRVTDVGLESYTNCTPGVCVLPVHIENSVVVWSVVGAGVKSRFVERECRNVLLRRSRVSSTRLRRWVLLRPLCLVVTLPFDLPLPDTLISRHVSSKQLLA